MADPFEVRMRFTSLLQHMSASFTSSQKAANYALKYRDMGEDLHSCILEQLERVRQPPLFPIPILYADQSLFLEQYEQPGQYNLFCRTPLRHGDKREPPRICPDDPT